jgi:hypothetical protein
MSFSKCEVSCPSGVELTRWEVRAPNARSLLLEERRSIALRSFELLQMECNDCRQTELSIFQANPRVEGHCSRANFNPQLPIEPSVIQTPW